jgi:hypothetical protein
MSQFYSLKAVLEEVLGRRVYLTLKETATMKDWRKATTRLLKAVEFALTCTVSVFDQEWRDDIAAAISHGQDTIKSSTTISDLFAALSATLTRIVFLQIGFMPSRRNYADTVPLTADFWTLNQYRNVQYVQTASQKAALDNLRARRRRAATRVDENPP